MIAPFNFPLILAIRSVAPALALGNAVVLKPDPRTAVSGGVSIARIFEEAGLPDGVLHVLPGGADAGEALVADPHVRVDHLHRLHGGGQAGRRAGGRHLKRAHLELGGNSALIVLDDADLDLAASAGAWGSFLHQGQICMTTGRHLVHEDVARRRTSRGWPRRPTHLPVGDPATSRSALGPIIDADQRDKIHALVTASVDAGARLVAGGTYDGLFYRPTVLADVTPATPAYAQEVFGPVAPVISFGDASTRPWHWPATPSTGFRSASSREGRHGGLAIAEQIPSGIVHINDQTVGDEAVARSAGSARPGRAPGSAALRPTWTRSPRASGSRCRERSSSTPSDLRVREHRSVLPISTVVFTRGSS